MASRQVKRARPIGGMDDRWNAEAERPALLENVYVDHRGTIRTCGGYTQISTAAEFDTMGKVHSITWFSQHQGGRHWLVWEYESSGSLVLAYMDYTTDSVIQIQGGRTLVQGPNAGTTYLEHANWLYVFNAYDKPVRWNGTELVEVGFSVRPPPPVAAISGNDQADANYGASPAALYDPNGFQRGVGSSTERFRYGYAITWVNDLGHESPRSAVAWVEGAGSGVNLGKKSIIVEIAEAPINVRGVRLWRTVNYRDLNLSGGLEPPMYLVAAIPGAGRMHYIDDAADAEIGPIHDPDASGLFPSRVQFVQLFKETLFASATGDASRIWYSAPRFIEQMPEVNYLPVGDAQSGQFMGFKSTKNALVVFKRRGIYLVKGDPLNGFYAETLTEDVGCAAPRSIVEVPGAGTVFLTDDGPYLLEGALENTGTPTRAAPIVGPISGIWNDEVNTKALQSARASRHIRDSEVWFHVPSGGGAKADLGLIFHIPTNGWSIRRGFPFSCLTEDAGHRGYLFAGSHSTTAAESGVVVYSRGYDQVGTEVTATIDSAWLNVGIRVTPAHIHLQATTTGRDFEFQSHVDRDVLTWLPATNIPERRFLDEERKIDQWGLTSWGTGSWHPEIPVIVRCDPQFRGALEFQWRIRGGRVALVGFDYEYVVASNIPKRGLE